MLGADVAAPQPEWQATAAFFVGVLLAVSVRISRLSPLPPIAAGAYAPKMPAFGRTRAVDRLRRMRLARPQQKAL
jgi:hypothetical protein